MYVGNACMRGLMILYGYIDSACLCVYDIGFYAVSSMSEMYVESIWVCCQCMYEMVWLVVSTMSAVSILSVWVYAQCRYKWIRCENVFRISAMSAVSAMSAISVESTCVNLQNRYKWVRYETVCSVCSVFTCMFIMHVEERTVCYDYFVDVGSICNVRMDTMTVHVYVR